MFKFLLFIFICFSSLFAEENITGLFGLKLNHQYTETGSNVIKVVNKEAETISFFNKNVPEPLFFFFELPDINNSDYVVKTYKNKIIFISGSFNSENVSQERVNHMLIKINELKDLISNKYNLSSSDFLYLKNDKSIPYFPASLANLTSNGNGLFKTEDDFKIIFSKNNVKYNILFSYSKVSMKFEMNVENVLDNLEIEKLVKSKVINAI